ncbi:hypothetical protein PRIPAC_70655 [Pristionchus pacificus]|uniref:Uncharacterized protein n=1 Tax=Pristionchus pacificus TaxID=54126 RepID=A0A2A6CG15_PRIPA|nr:hypothetical protein PRIPAC_70655 [Pristionchus pacificus]|eukprot:PDM77165.1 hypothetical protein PRIPAC_43077 [Pristionchus pacificus]
MPITKDVTVPLFAAILWGEQQYAEDACNHLPVIYGEGIATKLKARLGVEAKFCSETAGGRVSILASATVDGATLLPMALHVGPRTLPIRSVIHVDVRGGKVSMSTCRFDTGTAADTLVKSESIPKAGAKHLQRCILALHAARSSQECCPAYTALAAAEICRVVQQGMTAEEVMEKEREMGEPLFDPRPEEYGQPGEQRGLDDEEAANLARLTTTPTDTIMVDALLDVPPSTTRQSAPARPHALPTRMRSASHAGASSRLDVSMASSTASVRKALGRVGLDEKEEEAMDNSAMEESLLTAAARSPVRSEDVAIVEEDEEMQLARGAPLDDTMHSAGGRLSIVLDDEEEMDYSWVAPLDATMRSAGGRRSLANPDALEEEDEVMPLAASDRKSRRYVRVRHRLGQSAGTNDAAAPAVPTESEVAKVEDPKERKEAESIEEPEKVEEPTEPQDHQDPKEIDEDPKEIPLAPPSPHTTRRILAARRSSGFIPPRADAVPAAAAAPVEPDATEGETAEEHKEEEYAPPIENGHSPDHYREDSPPPADFHDNDDAFALPDDASRPGTPRRYRILLVPLKWISPEMEEHACSPLKRSRMTIDALEKQLAEAVTAYDNEKFLHACERRAHRRDMVLLEEEWSSRAGARADTYRLAAEIEALEIEVAEEKARAHAAHQVRLRAAIAIAAAAAVAAAVQRVAQALAPAVAAAPAPGAIPVPALGAPVVPAAPAPNAQFAADMAAIKARLLTYLNAPGVVTKVNGKASERLSKDWRSLTITAGHRLKKVKEVAAIGAARITAATVADPANLAQLTDFYFEATVTLNEYDELAERVEAFGAKIVDEYDRTGRKVAWSKPRYGDEYAAIKAMADEDLESLKDFGESCTALPLPL